MSNEDVVSLDLSFVSDISITDLINTTTGNSFSPHIVT